MTYLTVAQAAARKGVSTAAIKQWIKAKRLPFKRLGRAYMLLAADVDKCERRAAGRPKSRPTPPSRRRLK